MCNVVVNIGTAILGGAQVAGGVDRPQCGSDTPDHASEIATLRQQFDQLRGAVERSSSGHAAMWRELTSCYPLNPDHPVSRSWKLRLVRDELLDHIAALQSRVVALELLEVPQRGAGGGRIAAR